ncbi:MAG: hypothetical protein WCZ15_02935 [Patescibacteria group bacterium]
MEKDELENILSELYRFYPELKQKERELIVLIKEMKSSRPDIKFDEDFALNLRQRLLSQAPVEKNNKFNFNIMNKKIFIAAGSLVVACLLFIAAINIFGPNQTEDAPWQIAPLFDKKEESKISYLPSGSFGDLSDLSMTSSDAPKGEVAINEVSRDSLQAPAPEQTEADYSSVTAVVGMGGGMDVDTRMILPIFNNFDYVYTGNELNLEQENALVYKRLKNEENLGKDLARTLNSFNFPQVSLNTFSNLKVNSISFVEDKEQGLMINFELKEGGIYIYEDWEKWRIAEREACGNDQACWDRFKIKIEDVPADSELISIANNFLSEHKIDIAKYGEPQVDNQWRRYYEYSEDKANYYIPEQATVIYPTLIEDEPARDQSGNYTGLRVGINLFHNKVSSLNGLIPYNYEASAYDLETSSERIIALAEKGGWNRSFGFYGSEAQDREIVELGTPEFSYVQMWRYKDNENIELFVPALIFPVTKRPETGYYGNNFVVLPLVKELISDIEKQEQDFNILRTEPQAAIDTGLILEKTITIDDISQGQSEEAIAPIEMIIE